MSGATIAFQMTTAERVRFRGEPAAISAESSRVTSLPVYRRRELGLLLRRNHDHSAVPVGEDDDVGAVGQEGPEASNRLKVSTARRASSS